MNVFGIHHVVAPDDKAVMLLIQMRCPLKYSEQLNTPRYYVLTWL